jgi:hypothetical protein
MPKSYTCVRCGKIFFDKTKYDKHNNRKYKCKFKKGFANKKDHSIKCVLCDMNIGDSYQTHLEKDCPKSKVKITKYGYKAKNFAKTVFKDSGTNYADLYIMSMKDDEDKCKLNFLKNMYSLTKKKDDVEMYDLKYYLPIKDIDLFVEKVEDIDSEEYIDFDTVLNISAEELLESLGNLIKEINENQYIVSKPVVKYCYEYICPKCPNVNHNNLANLYRHLEMYHLKSKDDMLSTITVFDELNNEDIQDKVLKLMDKSGKACEICGKMFSSKSNRNKHQKKCKSKVNVKDSVGYLIQENDKLQNEVKVIKKLLLKEKQRKKNIINNTTNIMQNNIQININDYGKEDISHIPMEFVKDLISKMNTYSIVKYIEAVHFENPMNTNIVIPNDLNVILMKNGNSWAMNDKDRVLNGMIVKNFDRINDIYEKLSPNLPKFIKESYTQYAETFDTDIPNERERVKVNTEKMIINKQNSIMANQLEDTIKGKNIVAN